MVRSILVLMSVVAGFVCVVHGDTLTVNSTDSSMVLVRYSADQQRVEVVKGGVVVDSQSTLTVSEISYVGSAGNDFFVNATAIDLSADSGGGLDVLIGGSGEDLLIGGDGDDLLIGGAGADRIFGSSGRDLLIECATVYEGRFDDLAS